MTFLERLDQVATSLAVATIAAIAGGIGWMVRRIVTNQAQIDLLKSDIQHRDALRETDREALKTMQAAILEMQGDIKLLLGRKP